MMRPMKLVCKFWFPLKETFVNSKIVEIGEETPHIFVRTSHISHFVLQRRHSVLFTIVLRSLGQANLGSSALWLVRTMNTNVRKSLDLVIPRSKIHLHRQESRL